MSASTPTPQTGSLNAASASTGSGWQPDLRLHESLVAVVQRFINHISAAHLELLLRNELFGSTKEGYERVQNFAFSQSFGQVDLRKPRNINACI
jgi:hypothetical protein